MALIFNQDRCCHLVVCLQLILFIFVTSFIVYNIWYKFGFNFWLIILFCVHLTISRIIFFFFFLANFISILLWFPRLLTERHLAEKYFIDTYFSDKSLIGQAIWCRSVGILKLCRLVDTVDQLRSRSNCSRLISTSPDQSHRQIIGPHCFLRRVDGMSVGEIVFGEKACRQPLN
jgi:hypothetical protein